MSNQSLPPVKGTNTCRGIIFGLILLGALIALLALVFYHFVLVPLILPPPETTVHTVRISTAAHIELPPLEETLGPDVEANRALVYMMAKYTVIAFGSLFALGLFVTFFRMPQVPTREEEDRNAK